MRELCRAGRSLWHKLPCRLLLAAGLGASIGVAAARTFLGSVSVVSGTSMTPTFQPGTWVYTAPISTPLQRGDIVVIDDGHEEYAVKRLVGLPGETVYLGHGYVFINGKILLEPYLAKGTYTFPRGRAAMFILGEEQYFVLGDNRPRSADSRSYGPVERKQIKRRIPQPDGALRAHCGGYTLPAYADIHAGRTVPKIVD